jgi:hypothetical protein
MDGPEAEVVADTPLVEVESNPAGPDVATRFRRAVTHDNGGVFYSPGGKGCSSAGRATLLRNGLVVAVSSSTTSRTGICLVLAGEVGDVAEKSGHFRAWGGLCQGF